MFGLPNNDHLQEKISQLQKILQEEREKHTAALLEARREGYLQAVDLMKTWIKVKTRGGVFVWDVLNACLQHLLDQAP